MSGAAAAVPRPSVVSGFSRTAAAVRPGRLLNRNFLLLSQAQLVSQFGNQAFTVAVTFWTAQTTQSATITGLVVMASLLPMVLLAPLTGTFADRERSRLRIVVTCDAASGVLVSLLAFGFVAGPADWRLPMLFAVATLVGVSRAFFEPAINALAPDLVPRERLEAANAFGQSSRHVTSLCAQALGGVLFMLIGAPLLFLMNGMSFFFAAGSEMLIRTAQRDDNHTLDGSAAAAGRSGGVLPQIAEGMRYVRAQPGMVGFLLIVAVFNLLLMPIAILLPVFVTTYLHADVRWYGFLLAAISGGAIAGCALVGTMRSRLTQGVRGSVFVSSLTALALVLAALGQVESRWLALLLIGLTGVLSGMVNVLVLSIVQRRTAAEFLGRVMGLHVTITRALAPIGLVGGGVIADLTGRNVPIVYAVCGALALIGVTLLAARRTTRVFLASA